MARKLMLTRTTGVRSPRRKSSLRPPRPGSPAAPDGTHHRTPESPDANRHPAAASARIPVGIAPTRTPAPAGSNTPGKRRSEAHGECRAPTPSAAAPATAAPATTPAAAAPATSSMPPAAAMPSAAPARFGANGREGDKTEDQRDRCETLHKPRHRFTSGCGHLFH